MNQQNFPYVLLPAQYPPFIKNIDS